MGEHERVLPNGLLPNEAASVVRVLDSDRWLKAEERTAEIISCIQPNGPSERCRNAVADYVQRLISKCFTCEVFTFGSVPLKTYLPDGDIDLTAFSNNQNLKDTWAHQVRDILETEEKNENAEFRVKEVQYIQAEVKLIKCLVENIVVDISFNQLGGLCTLCFLEEVDHLINQDHLFKKSIILIKAWCYYESRILGAHHGLISTYALETLVLYIFHVFNNTFAGPLEVLYRFLEFFSKFDWDNFCVSLWGPVPISSLPDMTAEPPRNDSGELLLSKPFLEACSSVYAVGPGLQENYGQHFMSKFFNVIDPLRVNNNLGRSVSKGNFYRIRSAFAFGAKRLARLLECPKEDIVFEVNQFFMNTWDRHGSGQRPDAPKNELLPTSLPTPELSHRLDNLRDNLNNITFGYEVQVDVSHGNYPSESSLSSEVSHSNSQKTNANLSNTVTSDKSRRENSASSGVHTVKTQRSVKLDNLVAGENQARHLFARTRSSPELTETYGEVLFQGRNNRTQETGKVQTSSSRSDNRRKNPESENFGNHGSKSSAGDPSSARHPSSRQNIDAPIELRSISSSRQDDSGMGIAGNEFASAYGVQGMHQEEQDFVNIMASSAGLGFNGQVHFPLNLGSNQMPYPIPPSVLASMGYAPQRNLGAMTPANIPLIENLWGANMQFPQGLVSSPLTHYFSGMGMATNTADSVEHGKENFGSLEANTREADHEFWHEHEMGSTSGYDLEDGGFEMHQSDEKHQSSSASLKFVPSSRLFSNSMRAQQKFYKDHAEVQLDDRLSGSRPSSSLRSRTSSESSREGSSAKASKSSREKKNRKTASSAVFGKGKNSSENSIDEECKNWNAMPSMGTEMSERSIRPLSASATLGFETSQTSGSEPLLPLGAPVILGPNSTQRTSDDTGVLPFTFYPAGPPVPFVMLPVYNVPTESGNSDASTSHFSVEEVLDTSDSGQNFESADRLDQSEALSTSSTTIRAASGDPLEHKPDILHSDFASHWQNLQFGRFCQGPRYSSPLVYGPSLMVPPVYLQGRFPWDGPGRPLSTNTNVLTQLMSYGPRIVPTAPLQSVSNRPASVYQHYADELPRHRSGTGTYLPNPMVSIRDRHSTNSRKGSYSYDRNDQHGDREGNRNANSRHRAGGRNHSRSQTEKSSSRMDRTSWTPHRHDSSSSYQSQNGQNSSQNVAYGMYPVPVPSMNNNHGGPVSSNGGPTFPPVVMLYPYDRRAAGYSGLSEQLEFGSLGPLSQGSRSTVGFEDQRYHVSSSSPDQPSSPLFHR